MKTRLFIFSTLGLAVMCLGSASIAMAQSITGGGVTPVDAGGPPISISVAVWTGPAGPAGTVRFGRGNIQLVSKVADLCVVGNAAIVITEITQSTVAELPIGSFAPWVFEDNGQTGDRLGFFTGPFDEFTPCSEFVDFLDFILATDADVFTLTRGNITITP